MLKSTSEIRQNLKSPLLSEKKIGAMSRSQLSDHDSKLTASEKVANVKCDINFKKLLDEHRNRTQKTFPFTLQQVEDAIFVDENHIISLEYIFYQKNTNYLTLKECQP